MRHPDSRLLCRPASRPASRAVRLAILAIGLFLIGCGVWQVGNVAIIQAKAWLAPILVERAWERALAGEEGAALKPWPWADTMPALKLTFPSRGETVLALEGATARAMAFGPVLEDSGETPVLFGHRDSHFRFLKDLEAGEAMTVQYRDGHREAYQIAAIAVRHKDSITIPKGRQGDYFALVTCYPFDAAEAGGPLRYVLLAKRAPAL